MNESAPRNEVKSRAEENKKYEPSTELRKIFIKDNTVLQYLQNHQTIFNELSVNFSPATKTKNDSIQEGKNVSYRLIF